MKKLSELNVHHLLLLWICSYLSNRYQHVAINSKSSSTLDVLSGVPQGSVLWPLLVLIYIVTITSLELSDGTKMLLYADDMLIYKPVANNCCYHELQDDVNNISQLSDSNLMHFNVAKCKCMLLACRRNVYCPTLKLKGVVLEQVFQHKYLGVIISSNLNQMCKRAS